MKKKIFAVLLTLCMILTLVPAAAWAAEDADRADAQKISICPNGETKYTEDSGRIEGVTDWETVTVYLGDEVIKDYEISLYYPEGGTVTKNDDGTFTFVTNGSGEKYMTIKYGDKTADFTVLIADPFGDEQREAVKNAELKLSTKMVKASSGKKAVKLTWKCKSEIPMDGFAIYRSTKKSSGYGKKPIAYSKKNTYTNTSVKAGKKYYYKVRGYVVIDCEKVYTDYSNVAYRTVK